MYLRDVAPTRPELKEVEYPHELVIFDEPKFVTKENGRETLNVGARRAKVTIDNRGEIDISSGVVKEPKPISMEEIRNRREAEAALDCKLSSSNSTWNGRLSEEDMAAVMSAAEKYKTEVLAAREANKLAAEKWRADVAAWWATEGSYKAAELGCEMIANGYAHLNYQDAVVVGVDLPDGGRLGHVWEFEDGSGLMSVCLMDLKVPNDFESSGTKAWRWVRNLRKALREKVEDIVSDNGIYCEIVL